MLRGNDIEGPYHFKHSMMLGRMELESLELEIKCLNSGSTQHYDLESVNYLLLFAAVTSSLK